MKKMMPQEAKIPKSRKKALSSDWLLENIPMLFGLAYQGKDIMFRFIIELKGLWPLGGHRSIFFIWGFLKDDILAGVGTSDLL
jgi:hypothetical protein